MRYLVLSSLLALGLTASSQVPDYVPTDGLVAWYPMNGNALDESGNGYHCDSFGAVLTADRHGASSSAFNFDGEGSHLRGASLPFSDLSISLWFKHDSGGYTYTYDPNSTPPIGAQLVGQGTAHNPCSWADFAIGFADAPTGNDDLLAWEKSNAGGCSVQQSSADWLLETDTWIHLIAISQGTQVDFFIDGDWVNSVEFDEPFNFTGSVFSIGARYVENCSGGEPCSGPGNAWSGAIDDVAVWNRALTPQEISSLYNGVGPITGCTDETACNYNPEANVNDGSCYSCDIPAAHCGEGTFWDDESQSCVIANPSDTDFDGCVSMTDLLDLLSVFGTCNETPWSCGDPLEYQGYDYETVQIGEQCWFAENLRAHQFRNGDIIPSGLSDGQWTAAESPAMAWYGEASTSCENFVPEFDACNGVPSDYNFGGLYNGYVVTDARPVCPSGWSTPSMSDFYTLLNNYEDAVQAADALKAQSTWSGEDSNGSNLSGFKAFASGFRRGLGTSISEPGFYDRAGVYGNFWADDFTNEESFLVYGMSLTPQIGVELLDGIQWSPAPGGFGFSVRCIQDSE